MISENKIILQKKNKIFIFEKKKNEIKEYFLIRIFFIIKNLNSSNINLLENLSYIHLNKNILKNEYDKSVEKQMGTYIQKPIL